MWRSESEQWKYGNHNYFAIVLIMKNSYIIFTLKKFKEYEKIVIKKYTERITGRWNQVELKH